MGQEAPIDKGTLQVLLTTLRKISVNIQNVKEAIVPKLEITIKDLDSLKSTYDTMQKDQSEIVSEFDLTQNQLSKNFFILKDSITSQNEIIQENKQAIESLKNEINTQQQQIVEDLKSFIQDQIEKFLSETELKEFQEKQLDHNKSVSNDLSNLSDNILPNIIANIGDVGKVIVEIRRKVLEIDSKLVTPSGVVADVNVEGKDLQTVLQTLPQQITYKAEEHKTMVLSILDGLIETFSGKTLTIDELEGSFVKQLFITARTQVYEQTEGIAPRFRQAMDALIALFEDGAVYPISNLRSVVRSLRDIRKIYEVAPVFFDGVLSSEEEKS